MSNYYRPGGFGGFSFFPPVIKNLLIINGVVFLIMIIGGEVSVNNYNLYYVIMKYFALIPIEGFGDFNFYPWQLITYQFMHGGFTHILFNMFALWMFGMEIENMWGSKKFLYFYLLCGIVAGLCHLLISPIFGMAGAPTVGASGAIYGVLAAFALVFPNRYIFLYFFIPVKAKYLIAFLILLDIFALNDPGNIARLAHLGGAAAGLIYILLDSSINAEIKNLFRKSSYRTTKSFNPFENISGKFRRKETDVEEAKFYEVEKKDKDTDEDNITQQDIDEILDKISKSGYQKLSEKEKRILFEASKKMK